MKEYDVAIIGAGPAGLMAGVYSARYKLKTIIFGEVYGGTISEASVVCNFPTYTKVQGYELSQKMVEQVMSNGVEIKQDKIEKVEKKGNKFLLKTSEGNFTAKKIIVAVGRKTKHLGLKREKELKGKGVSYCANCDGFFFKDKVVAVVGGGDAALSSAVLLGDLAKKVYLIHRRNKFRAEPIWVDLVEKNKKIESIFSSNVVELRGAENLSSIKLDSGKILEVDGVFIEIGSEPESEFLESMGLALDENKYVKVDSKLHTNIRGVFSAGDLNSGNFKQAVVAVAEGAIAANSVYEEIKRESLDEPNVLEVNGAKDYSKRAGVKNLVLAKEVLDKNEGKLNNK